MSRVGHWAATLAFAAAGGTAFALLLIWASPRGPDGSFVSSGVTVVTSPWTWLFSMPWAMSAGILWHAWTVWAGARLSAMDAPARLLAIAVATLPAELRDWGVAMRAELAQVPDRRARWRFAVGCARTAAFPPRYSRLSALVVAALAIAAVIATGLAVGWALPTMRLFAVTLVVLVGALVTVAVARSRRLRWPRHGPLITIAGLTGVAVCIAVIGYNLGTDASETLIPSAAITLAIVLAACLWLTLAPPRALTTSKHARWVGVGGALVLAASVFVAARFNATNDAGVLSSLLNVPVIFLMASSLVALFDRSFSAGLQATVWALMVTCLLTFAVVVMEALRWYQIHQTSLLDGDTGTGGNLQSAIVWVLLAIPVMALPCGVIGAALGTIGAKARGDQSPVPVERSST